MIDLFQRCDSEIPVWHAVFCIIRDTKNTVCLKGSEEDRQKDCKGQGGWKPPRKQGLQDTTGMTHI